MRFGPQRQWWNSNCMLVCGYHSSFRYVKWILSRFGVNCEHTNTYAGSITMRRLCGERERDRGGSKTLRAGVHAMWTRTHDMKHQKWLSLTHCSVVQCRLLLLVKSIYRKNSLRFKNVHARMEEKARNRRQSDWNGDEEGEGVRWAVHWARLALNTAHWTFILYRIPMRVIRLCEIRERCVRALSHACPCGCMCVYSYPAAYGWVLIWQERERSARTFI